MGLAIELQKCCNSVILDGVLDISTADRFMQAVAGLENANPLTLNLRRVNHVDLTGIGALLGVIKQRNRKGLTTRVVDVSQDVYEILESLGVPEMFVRSRFEIIRS